MPLSAFSRGAQPTPIPPQHPPIQAERKLQLRIRRLRIFHPQTVHHRTRQLRIRHQKTALDARALFDELLTSSHLTSDERIQLEGYVSQLNEVIAADTFDIMDNALVFIAEAMFFSVFDLSEARVGEIPPPFPGE